MRPESQAHGPDSSSAGPRPRTMFDKVWSDHVVAPVDEVTDLLYIDLHLVHEVSSPQAFDGLRQAGRVVRRPDLTLAMMDHAVMTSDRSLPIADEQARVMLDALTSNCSDFNIELYGLHSSRQGIVHMVGPEQGLTQPGMTVACGDSHTSTHGAFGCLAVGIGTSEVEHVLATQTLVQRRPRTMAIEVTGELPFGTTAKDLVLHLIGVIGVDGGVGYAIEYRGPAITALTMEARMTVCNMTIEAGSRIGMIAPDQVTYDYLEGRSFAPSGAAWDQAMAEWRRLPTDDGAVFDATVNIDASTVAPTVTWGTNPGMSVSVTSRVPRPQETSDPEQAARALEYMGLSGGERITDLALDRVFIGSCTNGRIEDLRAAVAVVGGHVVAPGVRAMIVPGSIPVKWQAESEGLDEVFRAAGFEWREPGCSMCLGMNPDVLAAGERCASTSNRNFEGRQGRGGRTHLVSPSMAAAAAIAGHFVDVRELR